MRIVRGLDVHKDNVFVCIMNENGDKFEAKYGGLTLELEELRQLLLDHGVQEVTMESTSIYWHPVWRVLEGIGDFKPLFHQTASRSQERCAGCRLDSGMHAEGPYPWKFRPGFPGAAHASVQPSHLRPEQGEGL